jgi:hypothetical protein
MQDILWYIALPYLDILIISKYEIHTGYPPRIFKPDFDVIEIQSYESILFSEFA